MFNFFKSKAKKIFKASFSIGGKIRALFAHSEKKELFTELEKLFFEADLGVETAIYLTEKVRAHYLKKHLDAHQIIEEIKKELLSVINTPDTHPSSLPSPYVILTVGANGSGKTTSVAKLAYMYKNQGKKVLIAAADTFRAAAVEQLKKWAETMQIEIVLSQSGGDPSAVVFDALEAAKARNIDIVLIDTAGRLHTKTDLMQELYKIQRVCQKQIPQAPHQTLLVLDATIGQNALDQARTFNTFVPISGIVLTKLDGSAKGGCVIALKKELDLPVLWIGTGETLDNITAFDAQKFVDALLQ